MAAALFGVSALGFATSMIQSRAPPTFAWSPAAAAALPVGLPAPLRSPMGVVSNLLATTLRWGLSSCGDADDVMLAMVSPEAYWLLRDWRTRAFGDQEAMRGAMRGVRQRVMRAARAEEALRGATVTVRTKGLFSTFHKAVVRKQQVHDVLALRVVLRRGLDEQACFDAHDALRRVWTSSPGRYKDYVACPKPNGYQALHDTMVLPSACICAPGRPFEVQVRSEEMHREAETGAAAHRRYKGALARLPMAVLTGVAGASSPGTTSWPLQPETALGLAARLSQ